MCLCWVNCYWFSLTRNERIIITTEKKIVRRMEDGYEGNARQHVPSSEQVICAATEGDCCQSCSDEGT